MPPEGNGRVLVVACGALAREILAVTRQRGLNHLDVTCLPAILHNRPEKIPDAVEAAVTERGGDYASVFVAYADCGTGGALAATCTRLGVSMIEGPHCYSFFEGNAAFAAHGEGTAFYLTDFLARQFDAFVWRPLGLDRHPELLPMYFGNYETLVHQVQAEDPDTEARARRAAARLGLRYEKLFTGYGDLETALAAL
ncbi:DUF1638 domain-containing protein [Tropicimonas sp. IMCC34011]|uniref:DUF1638 domain-containing protein n=1 Tax=Tropicimonas sp. IMCC34011 TaxID=2248759 RepID=UPI000E259E68|nr:DUF1638 domain-containing protein [Tropicimonas sp. IMCC34011]